MWEMTQYLGGTIVAAWGRQTCESASEGDKVAIEVAHSTLLRRRWREKRRRKIEREIAANCTLFLDIELAFCFGGFSIRGKYWFAADALCFPFLS